jgi:hypothetical protein
MTQGEIVARRAARKRRKLARTREWIRAAGQYRLDAIKYRAALQKIVSLVQTNQGCSTNNHAIAVICLDTL